MNHSSAFGKLGKPSKPDNAPTARLRDYKPRRTPLRQIAVNFQQVCHHARRRQAAGGFAQKFEIRSTKSETNPKYQIRNSKQMLALPQFKISDFVLRISSFWAKPAAQ